MPNYIGQIIKAQQAVILQIRESSQLMQQSHAQGGNDALQDNLHPQRLASWRNIRRSRSSRGFGILRHMGERNRLRNPYTQAGSIKGGEMKTKLTMTDRLIDSAVYDDAALLTAHMAHANLERIYIEALAALESVQVDYIAWNRAEIENPITMTTEKLMANAINKGKSFYTKTTQADVKRLHNFISNNGRTE